MVTVAGGCDAELSLASVIPPPSRGCTAQPGAADFGPEATVACGTLGSRSMQTCNVVLHQRRCRRLDGIAGNKFSLGFERTKAMQLDQITRKL